jgi:cell division protein FtsN
MNKQRGGFVVGLIVGVLGGLAVALAVAMYVTKVPVPFVDKVPQRTAAQDAAETERNRQWDPNTPLATPPAPRPTLPPPATPAARPPGTPPVAGAVRPPGAVPPGRDPASILSGGATPDSTVARAAPTGGDAFTYFVQVGAYSRGEDAEQQRARLAMLGFGARVTEREQSGRTVYRVRLGPYDRKYDADTAQARLRTSDIESALVRVERTATP